MSNLIAEISEQHARLRKLEGDLEALRSQLEPARKRIRIAREALDTLIAELATGQSYLPLFPSSPPEPSTGTMRVAPIDSAGTDYLLPPVDRPTAADPATEAERQPVRERRRKRGPS